jgi:hypothetical protein
MYKIYVLEENKKVIYVGITTNNLNNRLGAHVRKKHLSNKTQIKLIEENVSIEDISERESYWINFYKDNGFQLLNIREKGGNGLKIKGPNSREKHKENFIKKSKIKYKNKYDYSKIEYITCMDKVIIICPLHGEWEVTPDNHINKSSGCPKCSGFNLDNKEKIKLANQKHNNKYDYSLIKTPITQYDKYKIICPEHGVFEKTWNNHYSSSKPQGCPKCSKCGRKTTPIIDNKKICSKCKTNKNIKLFTNSKKPWCKSCTDEYNKVLYKNSKLT